MKLKAQDVDAPKRDLILGYGDGGVGKTRGLTSLTKRFFPMAYFAADQNGCESLSSVLPQYRDGITVFDPKVAWRDLKTGAPTWLHDHFELITNDWKKEGFNTLFLDSVTALANRFMHEGVQLQTWDVNHKEVGIPGTATHLRFAAQTDYGACNQAVMNFLSMLFLHQPELNVIVSAHVGESKQGKFGPLTTGKALVDILPGQFNAVLHFDTEKKPASSKTDHVVWTQDHGKYIARLNQAEKDGNPLKKVVLEEDPQHFWIEYDRIVHNTKEEK